MYIRLLTTHNCTDKTKKNVQCHIVFGLPLRTHGTSKGTVDNFS